MSKPINDEALRQAVCDAHRGELPPQFSDLLNRPVPRRRSWLPLALVPVSGVAAAIGLALCVWQGEQQRAFDQVVLSYQQTYDTAATDFLLETPASSWLGSVPEFGVQMELKSLLPDDSGDSIDADDTERSEP